MEQKDLSNGSTVPILQADDDHQHPGQNTIPRLLCDRDTLDSHTVLIFDIRGTSPIFMKLSPIITAVDEPSDSVISAPSEFEGVKDEQILQSGRSRSEKFNSSTTQK